MRDNKFSVKTYFSVSTSKKFDFLGKTVTSNYSIKCWHWSLCASHSVVLGSNLTAQNQTKQKSPSIGVKSNSWPLKWLYVYNPLMWWALLFTSSSSFWKSGSANNRIIFWSSHLQLILEGVGQFESLTHVQTVVDTLQAMWHCHNCFGALTTEQIQ